MYVEREDEFEDEESYDGDNAHLRKWEKDHQHEGLVPLDPRQMRLAQIDIDIDRKSSNCTTILSSIQTFAQQRPDL